jgi:hypothetical protein
MGEAMATALVNTSDLAWHSFYRRLGRIVGEFPCREGAKWPTKRIPKGSTQMLALSATLGQLDHFTALVFQQDGEQSTLRKGQR